MTMKTNNNVYPALDLEALRSSRDSLSGHATAAQVLSIKYEYLPEVLERFKRLRGHIDAAARGLNSASLASKVDLEFQVKKLRGLQAEGAKAGASADLLVEIEQDLASTLSAMFIPTRKAAISVSQCLANISDGYDNGMTSGYSDKLQRDQQVAMDAKPALEKALVDLGGQRKVIRDAIEAIEKAGVEKINQQIGLSIDQINALGMAPPEAQLVAFAIEQLKKSLADINEAVTFMSMLNESDRLLREIHGLQDRIKQIDRDIEQFAGKIAFIREIHTMSAQCDRYAQQYRQVDHAFQKFLAFAKTNATGEIKERTTAAIEEAVRFIAFLAPVSLS